MPVCDACRSILEANAHFCPNCGVQCPVILKEVDTKYFNEGHPYAIILRFLQERHNVKMSLRTLKNKLKSFGLRRRKEDPNLLEVRNKIASEVRGSGVLMGYRAMWQHLRLNHGMHVRRDTVATVLRETNPEASDFRRRKKLRRRSYVSKGPNDCWHADGYDKLKRYGFPIHACIDGFSRRILWLEISNSNNDPYVIASFYLETVQKIGVLPRRLRTDCGTENGTMAAMQCFLRRSHGDTFSGEKAHVYGSSTNNQRIEAWWSQLRRGSTQFFMNFFQDLVDVNDVDLSNDLHIQCLRYCFKDLLKRDICQFVDYWNTHYIRKSKYNNYQGRPNQLYFVPPQGFKDVSHAICYVDMLEMREYLDEWRNEENSRDLHKSFFDHVSIQLNLPPHRDWETAKENFCRIFAAIVE